MGNFDTQTKHYAPHGDAMSCGISHPVPNPDYSKLVLTNVQALALLISFSELYPSAEISIDEAFRQSTEGNDDSQRQFMRNSLVSIVMMGASDSVTRWHQRGTQIQVASIATGEHTPSIDSHLTSTLAFMTMALTPLVPLLPEPPRLFAYLIAEIESAISGGSLPQEFVQDKLARLIQLAEETKEAPSTNEIGKFVLEQAINQAGEFVEWMRINP